MQRLIMKRAMYAELKRKHRRKVWEEKRKYYHHRHKARTHPEKYMSIIIDGMDQSKTDIPQFVRDTKDSDSVRRLKSCITGVLIHGHAPHAICYVSPDRYPKDSNMSCAILMDTLRRCQAHAPLPPVLYLQLDNTTRENKNQNVVSLCAALVEKGIFDKVRISFLPVGHTHEDIDQMFSRFAAALRIRDVYTPSEFAEVIKESFTPTPVVVPDPTIPDFGTWFVSFSWNNWHGITSYRCFKLWRHHETQHAVVQARKRMVTAGPHERSIGKKWAPPGGQRVFQDAVPDDNCVKLVVAKKLSYDVLTKMVDRLVAKNLLTDAHQDEWVEYLAVFQSEDDAVCPECSTFRDVMTLNGNFKRDSKEEKRRKNQLHRDAKKALKVHQTEPSCGQPLCEIEWPRTQAEQVASNAVVVGQALPDAAAGESALMVDRVDAAPEMRFVLALGVLHRWNPREQWLPLWIRTARCGMENHLMDTRILCGIS